MPSRREIILLCLALTTLIVGGYVLYFDTPRMPTTPQTDARLQKMKALSSTTANRLAKLENNGPRKALQRILNEQWTHDPFIHTPKRNRESQTAPSTLAAIEYTGFIEMNNIKIAIINGKEYEQGEVLETGDLRVQSISRQRVQLRHPSQKKVLTILFKDIEQPGND